MREKIEKLLERLLRERCPDLFKEKEGDKTLFFCKGELVGSVVRIEEDKLAGTVYSYSIGDSLHKEFLELTRGELGDRIEEEGTKTSSGVDQNFYYTYVHVKL